MFDIHTVEFRNCSMISDQMHGLQRKSRYYPFLPKCTMDTDTETQVSVVHHSSAAKGDGGWGCFLFPQPIYGLSICLVHLPTMQTYFIAWLLICTANILDKQFPHANSEIDFNMIFTYNLRLNDTT